MSNLCTYVEQYHGVSSGQMDVEKLHKYNVENRIFLAELSNVLECRYVHILFTGNGRHSLWRGLYTCMLYGGGGGKA